MSGTSRGQGGQSAWFLGKSTGGAWVGGRGEGVAVSHNMGARRTSKEARADKVPRGRTLLGLPLYPGTPQKYRRGS